MDNLANKSKLKETLGTPNIITLNEINLRKNKKLDIEGYKCFNKNRVNGNMGGVATLVAEKDYEEALKMSEGLEGNEYIVTRHSQFKVPINIINISGDVESRTPVDVIDKKWEEILKEISKIEAREELLIVIGDLNKHVSMKNNKSDTKN